MGEGCDLGSLEAAPEDAEVVDEAEELTATAVERRRPGGAGETHPPPWPHGRESEGVPKPAPVEPEREPVASPDGREVVPATGVEAGGERARAATDTDDELRPPARLVGEEVTETELEHAVGRGEERAPVGVRELRHEAQDERVVGGEELAEAKVEVRIPPEGARERLWPGRRPGPPEPWGDGIGEVRGRPDRRGPPEKGPTREQRRGQGRESRPSARGAGAQPGRMTP